MRAPATLPATKFFPRNFAGNDKGHHLSVAPLVFGARAFTPAAVKITTGVAGPTRNPAESNAPGRARKAVDWQAAEELTANLRAFDALDPVKYDFALFGEGVAG